MLAANNETAPLSGWKQKWDRWLAAMTILQVNWFTSTFLKK